MALRVILTTGGTGGHIFPALAVAEALKQREPDVRILFVGGLYGPEGDLARKNGIEFVGLPVRGMLGRGFKMFSAAWAMGKAVIRARALIRDFRPDAVMGFGGYAAFATVFAAWLRGCPTGIHEQNAIPGVVNRVLGKLARRVCLSLPDAHHAFPTARSVLTGNPVRAEIAAVTHQPGASPTLLVMGGSQGAKAINSLLISLLAPLREAGISILHQTGPADLERVRAAYKEHGYSQEATDNAVFPFIHDMAAAYSRADLALCRAGATTLAELAATGTPAVLVPFPFAAHDHQTANALAVQNAGGAVMTPESEWKNRDMASLLLDLLQDKDTLSFMERAIRAMAKPDAADAVAREIISLASPRSA